MKVFWTPESCALQSNSTIAAPLRLKGNNERIKDQLLRWVMGCRSIYGGIKAAYRCMIYTC
jgi:hypothetical protein